MTNPYSADQNSAETQQPQYTAAQPAAYGYQQPEDDSLINGTSVKAWVVNLLLEAFLGLIWWIVILVSDGQPESRKNYVKARLIVVVIMTVVTIIFFMAFGSAIAVFLQNANVE